jgi:restriction system protein
MTRENESILDLLVEAPWWVSVSLSASLFVILKFIVPAIQFENLFVKVFAQHSSGLAPLVALGKGVKSALASCFDKHPCLSLLYT